MVAINQHGQQLFFADMILKKRGKQPQPATRPPRRVPWPAGYPVTDQQLVLFDLPRDLTGVSVRRLRTPIPQLAVALEQAVADHARAHGWRRTQSNRTWWGIRILLAIQDTPGARISTSEAAALIDVKGVTVEPVLEVLASVDMLRDDRLPPLEAWFTNHIAGLPEPMRGEVTEWFHAIRDGSTTPPRTRPRHIATVRNRVWLVMPTLRAWAADGHQSLREITRDQVVEALTTDHRPATLTGLRSLFRYLKARKLIFTNPTARLRGQPIQRSQPLPIELDPVRDALSSPDPARAALAAVIAFHALRNTDVRHLQLVDLRDGRMHVAGNSIVLADPVRRRLNAWLADRARRWPNTINPHLFISSRTAVRTTPVSAPWLIDKLGVSPQKLREDRILNEVIATGGDARRLCDLFGLSISSAQRYVDVITKPDERALTRPDGERPDTIGSGTQARN